MNNSQKNIIETQEEDELSLEEVIALVKEYSRYILAKKWWILSVVIIVITISGLSEFSKEPYYKAEYKFLVSENEGGASGISSLLGQFGVGGSGEGGRVNQQRLLLIGKSFPILSELLLKEVIFENHSDIVAAHIIRTQMLDTSLISIIKKGPRLESNTDSITLRYNQAIKSMVNYILTSNDPIFFSIIVNQKTSILNISFATKSAELSWILANTLYDLLTKFYIEKTTGTQQNNYRVLTEKKDSIYSLLLASERDLAKTTDKSRGVILAQDKVESIERHRKTEIYNSMYVEILTRQQTAEFLLLSSTPIFQELEIPMLPIVNSNLFNLKNVIMYGVLSFILIILIFIVRKVIEDNFRSLF